MGDARETRIRGSIAVPPLQRCLPPPSHHRSLPADTWDRSTDKIVPEGGGGRDGDYCLLDLVAVTASLIWCCLWLQPAGQEGGSISGSVVSLCSISLLLHRHVWSPSDRLCCIPRKMRLKHPAPQARKCARCKPCLVRAFHPIGGSPRCGWERAAPNGQGCLAASCCALLAMRVVVSL